MPQEFSDSQPYVGEKIKNGTCKASFNLLDNSICFNKNLYESGSIKICVESPYIRHALKVVRL